MIAKTKLLTRRQACAMAAAAAGAAALGLSGCSEGDPSAPPDDYHYWSEDGTTRRGYGTVKDTEVKSYPVHLRILADRYMYWYKPREGYPESYMNWEGGEQPDDARLLDQFAARYRHGNDRSQVTFEFEYVDPNDLLSYAQNGFPDEYASYDGVVGTSEMMDAGCLKGTIDGGTAELAVRDLSLLFSSDSSALVRAKGSNVELPPADTVDGDDAVDGSATRFMKLPEFNGFIAIADPKVERAGYMGNKALCRDGYYTRETGVGGAYDESIASKMLVYPDQDSAMAAVVAGDCQLGFALVAGLDERYPDVEYYYPDNNGCGFGGTVAYYAAPLINSAEPGVTRDFFEFVQSCKC